MSADATGHVFRHAPYSGAELTILLAIADSVNDLHGNEFWMTQANLAAKSRTSVRSVRRAMDTFVKDGWLVELEGQTPTGGGRDIRRFWFAHDDTREVVYDNRPPRPVDTKQPATMAGCNRPNATGQPATMADRTQEEPKEGTQTFSPDEEAIKGKGKDYKFDDAWAAYPCRFSDDGKPRPKVDKTKAREKWRALSFADKKAAWQGIQKMRAAGERFAPDMHRWLTRRSWEDWLADSNGLAPPQADRRPEYAGPTAENERRVREIHAERDDPDYDTKQRAALEADLALYAEIQRRRA